MARRSKALTQLIAGRGLQTVIDIGGRLGPGLPTINALRKVYPRLSLSEISILYRAGLAEVGKRQAAKESVKSDRPLLKDIPIRRDMPISFPNVNRIRYTVNVIYDRGSLRNGQYWTVFVDSSKPLTQAQLEQRAEAAFYQSIGSVGGYPPLRPGESLRLRRFEVVSAERWR